MRQPKDTGLLNGYKNTNINNTDTELVLNSVRKLEITRSLI